MEGSPRLHPRSKLRGIRRRRIKQMHAAVMPTPTDAVGSPQRLLHIALAAGDFRMFHEEQRPIRFSSPDAKPHRRRNNEFDHTTFLSTETIRQGATRRQIRRPGAWPFAARSSLSCHNRSGGGKRYGASTLSCTRKQLHHSLLVTPTPHRSHHVAC